MAILFCRDEHRIWDGWYRLIEPVQQLLLRGVFAAVLYLKVPDGLLQLLGLRMDR